MFLIVNLCFENIEPITLCSYENINLKTDSDMLNDINMIIIKE